MTTARGDGIARHRTALAALVAAAIAALTLAVYARAFGHQFVDWDDLDYVRDNALVAGRHWLALLRAVVSLNYHPLTLLSLALDARAPLSPRPFLVTNACLHALATLLAFALAWRLSGRRLRVAAFVALLFGLHPMHVESVAWISERKDVLYALFFLAAVLAYDRYLERLRPADYAAAFALFALACLSKGMAVAFPLVLVLLELWRRRPLLARRALLEKLPFFALAAAVGAIALDVQAGGDVHGLLQRMPGSGTALGAAGRLTPLQRLLLPTWAHLAYVARLFVPTGLCAYHPYPAAAALRGPQLPLALAFFVATLAVAAWDARRSRIVAFGVGWYLATIVFVLQWIPVGGAFVAERYTYLPYVGLTFAWAMALDAARARWRLPGGAAWGASALLAVALAARTPRQIDTWRDSETLWSRVLAVHPRCAVAFEYRGNARHLAGNLAGALSDLVTARGLGDRRAASFEELGTTYGALGRLDSALVLLDEATRLDPASGSAHLNRAITYLQLGRPREALPDLDRALALRPDEAADLLARRGYAHLLTGQYGDAAADLDRAILAGNQAAGTHLDRAQARLQLGDRAGAASDLRRTLALDPANAAARAELAALGASP